MALNVDDIIASMQSVHAGDRGQGLEEIRENLRATLGNQAMGPAGFPSSSAASSSRHASGGAYPKRRTTPQFRTPHPTTTADQSSSSTSGFTPSSYVDPDATMTASASNDATYTGPSPPPSSTAFPDSANRLGAGAYGNAQQWAQGPDYTSSDPSAVARSFGSAGSWNASSAGSSGFGFALGAPANTPQQTPSDRGHYFASAGQPPQAGAGLFPGQSPSGAAFESNQYAYVNAHGGPGSGLPSVAEARSPPMGTGSSDSGTMTRTSSNSPRLLVSGFHPIETSMRSS
ncbi:unnamed protein product [Parajaminaea phylloscopi]